MNMSVALKRKALMTALGVGGLGAGMALAPEDSEAATIRQLAEAVKKAVVPSALAATGLGLGMTMPDDSEAAMRIHLAPTKMDRLLPLREAPVRTGTGGMREGAGLYTTEPRNKDVQKFYEKVFKEKTTTAADIDSPAAAWTAHRLSPAITEGYDYRKKSVANGIYDALDRAERKVNLRQEARVGITPDDMRVSLNQEVDDAADNIRDTLKEVRRVTKTIRPDGELAEDEIFYQKEQLYRAVGRYIGFKKMVNDPELYVKPGEPGVAYKHILNTTREDKDFLWRHKKLSEQPEILEKVKSLSVLNTEQLGKLTGAELQNRLSTQFRDDIAASEALHKAGVAGARYLINGGKGPGFNEVLFAPDKDAIIMDIVKLGVPLALATTAVLGAYEAAEAMPKPLLPPTSKMAKKVVGGIKTGLESGTMKEANQFTFPSGPYKGKTIVDIKRTPKRSVWYLIFDDDSVGRIDKEEAELLAKNLGIHRYMRKFDNANAGDKKIMARGSALTRVEKADALPGPAATPMERLERVSKMGLSIQPYKQVKYKGKVIELPTPYADFLIQQKIVEMI